MALAELLDAARNGDLAAFERLVEATQDMVYAVVRRVIGDRDEALDAVQETYVRAFGKLQEIRDPEAFPGWLRRIAVTTALSLRRSRRSHFVEFDESLHIPVLDEDETSWSDAQRAAMAEAIVKLPDDDRLLCERFYHGGWTTARLAQAAGLSEPALRKRLQRIRDVMRKDIEMSEQKTVAGERVPGNLPQKIIELLARPRLTTIPENPVGRMWHLIQSFLPKSVEMDVPETISDTQVREALGEMDTTSHITEAGQGIHRIDSSQYLRTDLTIPLLLSLRQRSGAQSVLSAGKAYRVAKVGPSHLEAFHQAEWLRVSETVTVWETVGLLTTMVKGLYPGKSIRWEEIRFPLCEEGWELSLDWNGGYTVLLACGRYKDRIVEYLGNDPRRYTAIGAGFGLERMACAHFGIDDIRKVEGMRL